MTTNLKSRSYAAQRELARGDRVRLTEPVSYYTTIPAGTQGVLVSFSNAGFRGIEATVALDSGQTIHGISAGALARA